MVNAINAENAKFCTDSEPNSCVKYPKTERIPTHKILLTKEKNEDVSENDAVAPNK